MVLKPKADLAVYCFLIFLLLQGQQDINLT